MKKIDIFLKTFVNDFWLAQLSLETIKRNVKGYNNIIILVPEGQKDRFETRNLPKRTLVHFVNDYGNGYLWQQWAKLNAHNYCYGEYILFSDSDCLFDHKINLQDFVSDDKPEILYTSWDKVDQAICWKKPTEDLLGEPVEWETMRRNNLIYHRSTLVNLNKWNPNLESIIMKSEQFSEFNLLGSWAFKYERDKYNFINTDDWMYVPPKAIQVWSRASKEEGADDLHLREYIRTLETIMKCFNVPVP